MRDTIALCSPCRGARFGLALDAAAKANVAEPARARVRQLVHGGGDRGGRDLRRVTRRLRVELAVVDRRGRAARSPPQAPLCGGRQLDAAPRLARAWSQRRTYTNTPQRRRSAGLAKARSRRGFRADQVVAQSRKKTYSPPRSARRALRIAARFGALGAFRQRRQRARISAWPYPVYLRHWIISARVGVKAALPIRIGGANRAHYVVA